jgi:hypothetical protein
MFRRVLISTVLSLSLMFASGVFADAPQKDTPPAIKGDGSGVCSLIKDNIHRGVDTKAVTKTNIKLGNEVCYVVKCAIDGGGQLRLIIAGAVEAGSTPDVVSRCCVDAGADPDQVAGVLESLGEGFGYSSPGEGFVPMDTRTVGTTTGTRFVSPSTF